MFESCNSLWLLHVIKLLNYKNPSDESERAATAEPKHLLTHSSIVFWLKNPGKITLPPIWFFFFCQTLQKKIADDRWEQNTHQ